VDRNELVKDSIYELYFSVKLIYSTNTQQDAFFKD
jgi:hypothetical protein